MGSASARRYERVPFFVDLEVKDLSTGRSCRGRSFDLSRGGIGFFAPTFLPVGCRVRLALYLRHAPQQATAHVDAVIVRAQTETGGALLGATFDPELAPASQPLLCKCLDVELGSPPSPR